MNAESRAYDQLFDYISRYSGLTLTEEEKQVIQSAFTYKKIRRRQYFLQEGEICKYAGFIIKGAMRQYRVDDAGKEHIIHLYLENWWVSDRESFVMLTPSVYHIDAWEETELLILSQSDMNRLMRLQAVKEVTKQMDTFHSIAMQNRVNQAISFSGAERYNKLRETYPEFLQRFPQHIIASYLGITKETLSRIRNKRK